MNEISAELLLGSLYPELQNKWTVHCKGTFYRNYNDDVMSVNPDTAEVSLSRDGILRMLPDTLVSDVNELRGKHGMENYEATCRRRELLCEAFVPFDTVGFRMRLDIERKISELLEAKLDYVLRTYFGIDLDKEDNPYIRETAMLLPYVTHRRGNLQYVKLLLSTIFGCEVKADMSHRYSDTDSTRAWMPMVRYDILKEGMSAEQYRQETALLQPLARFIEEWFLPFDVCSRISFRQQGIHPKTGSSLILGYNSYLTA